MDKLLLRVNEAAEALSISRSKAYVMIARGELPAIRVGDSIRISCNQLRHWIDAQNEAAGASWQVRPAAGAEAISSNRSEADHAS